MTNNNDKQLTLADKAKQLFELVEQRKQIEKLEKQLKSEFKSLANNGALNLGGYTIIISESSRTGLNKKQLIADLGADFVSKYETVTTFQKLDIKKTA